MKQATKKSRTPLYLGLAVLVVGLMAATAFAFPGMGGNGFGHNEAAQTAIQNGDYAGWKAAMTADLTPERFDQIRAREQDMAAHHEAVEAALESGDFTAWQEAMGDRGMASEMTEEGFAIMVQIHAAMEDGDLAQADQLREQLHDELGIEGCPGMGPRASGGMRGHGMGYRNVQ